MSELPTPTPVSAAEVEGRDGLMGEEIDDAVWLTFRGALQYE